MYIGTHVGVKMYDVRFNKDTILIPYWLLRVQSEKLFKKAKMQKIKKKQQCKKFKQM